MNPFQDLSLETASCLAILPAMLASALVRSLSSPEPQVASIHRKLYLDAAVALFSVTLFGQTLSTNSSLLEASNPGSFGLSARAGIFSVLALLLVGILVARQPWLRPRSGVIADSAMNLLALLLVLGTFLTSGTGRQSATSKSDIAARAVRIVCNTREGGSTGSNHGPEVGSHLEALRDYGFVTSNLPVSAASGTSAESAWVGRWRRNPDRNRGHRHPSADQSAPQFQPRQDDQLCNALRLVLLARELEGGPE